MQNVTILSPQIEKQVSELLADFQKAIRKVNPLNKTAFEKEVSARPDSAPTCHCCGDSLPSRIQCEGCDKFVCRPCGGWVQATPGETWQCAECRGWKRCPGCGWTELECTCPEVA